MKYLLLLYLEEANRPARGVDDERWNAVTAEMVEAGVHLGGAPLKDVDTATTLRGGTMTDGPFAETKEILGGYYLLDVADLDEAASWASKLPIAEYGAVEIRPLLEYPGA